MNYFNFHTHTNFCDGAAEPEAYVQEAIKNKLTSLGFTCHSPLPFENGYSIKENNIVLYVSTVRNLQSKYRDRINIFLGTEFDFVPGMSDDFESLRKKLNPDYFISSVHLVRNRENGKLWFIDGPERNYTSGLTSVFNDDIKLAVTTYFEQVSQMITSLQPDIIGHIDKVKMHNKGHFFSEEETWYTDIISQVLDVVEKTKCIIEVNTRGLYKKRCDSFYPGIYFLKEIYRRKIPVTISSDAHIPEELILYYDEAARTLKDIGFKTIKCLSGKTWQDVAI
jgi:histidinol-phosphatase (PHP family)